MSAVKRSYKFKREFRLLNQQRLNMIAPDCKHIPCYYGVNLVDRALKRGAKATQPLLSTLC